METLRNYKDKIYLKHQSHGATPDWFIEFTCNFKAKTIMIVPGDFTNHIDISMLELAMDRALLYQINAHLERNNYTRLSSLDSFKVYLKFKSGERFLVTPYFDDGKTSVLIRQDLKNRVNEEFLGVKVNDKTMTITKEFNFIATDNFVSDMRRTDLISKLYKGYQVIVQLGKTKFAHEYRKHDYDVEQDTVLLTPVRSVAD